MKNHWEIAQSYIIFKVTKKEGEKMPGMHHTEVRSGDAPKPPFSNKTNKRLQKIRKSGFDQPSLFLSLHGA